MLTVSLVLLATALAISTVAISIAAYHDARDRDRRIRPQRTLTAAPPHAARPTLRIWQPQTTSPLDDTTLSATKRPPSAGPDIIVGSPTCTPFTRPHERPNAA